MSTLAMLAWRSAPARPAAGAPAAPSRALSRARRLGVPSSYSSRPPRRPVLVLAGSRFRDETERQRAIDRLSPKPPGAPADDASDPPPRLTREPSSRASRPRRFRDAYRESSGGLRGVRGVSGEDDDDDDGPDPRELARRRRAERAESESADRLEYLVAVIRRELGRPQALLAADADVKARRFDALSSALKNFGFVEVMFGLVKYYYAHWDEPPEGFESAAATRAEDEHESSAAGRDGESDESTSAASAADALEEALGEEDAAEAMRRIREALGGAAAAADEEAQDAAAEASDAASDERTRRRLLRAAQLRATGVEPDGSADDEDEETGEEIDLAEDFREMVRSYFSVDFVEGDDGREEMVVMTSPEFLAFLLFAIILSGRLGHWLVQTYLITPVDPLLR